MGNNLIEESLRSNKRRSKDCPAKTPQKRQLKEPLCSNQSCQNNNSNTFVTDLTNVNRKENGPEQNSNSEESSSWLSWFGF